MAEATDDRVHARLESLSPATGESLGSVPAARPRDVEAAVAEAAHVQRLWAQLRPADRARYMARAAQAVIDEADEIVALVGREQGRPRAEAEIMELLPAIGTLQWLAEHGPGILAGERIGFSRSQHPIKRGRWTYEPLGVVGRPRPGDRAVRHAAGRRRRGPHGGQRRRAQAVAARGAQRRADRPRLRPRRAARGAARRRCTGTPTSAPRWCRPAQVAQVRFTGSTRAGRQVGEACARGLKRSVLELGGKDAALVLADANLARAAAGIAWAAFANARPVRRAASSASCATSRWSTSCWPGWCARLAPGASATRSTRRPRSARS